MSPQDTSTHQVGRGMLRVGTGSVLFRTIVGPGYAVCVSTRNGTVGGMLHLGVEIFSVDLRLLEKRFDEFLGKLEKLSGSLIGAMARIVGGADILHLLPAGLLVESISKQVDLLRACLASRRVRVVDVRVGGHEARRVELSLPGGLVVVANVVQHKRTHSGLQLRQPNAAPHLLQGERAVNVDMGLMIVARGPTRLAAVLGSCVGIAMHDATTRIGGLAHVVMPQPSPGSELSSKFASTAVPALLEALAEAGASRRGLVAKLVGGATVLNVANREALPPIGRHNVEVARSELQAASVPILHEDVGGKVGRKVIVDLSDFRLVVKLLMGKEAV